MESKLLFEVPSLLIALVGWAATAMVILNRAVAPTQRRSLLFSSWVFWTAASFGSLVARGLLTAEEATAACGISSITFGMLVWLTRPRASQPG